MYPCAATLFEEECVLVCAYCGGGNALPKPDPSGSAGLTYQLTAAQPGNVFTLDSLRWIVNATRDLPGGSLPHVLTRQSFSQHGLYITQLTLTDPPDGRLARD